MTFATKKILGIDITMSSKQYILEEIRKYLKQFSIFNFKFSKNGVKPFVIFTPNPEIITYARKDGNFKQIVNMAQINIPDGAGVVWAAKKLYKIKLAKIAGADFMLAMVKMAEKESLAVGLIGGKGDLAVQTRECLLKNHPGLKIEVFEAPEIIIQNSEFRIQNYSKPDDYFRSLVKDLMDRKISLLFVALGFPKQEYFIDRIRYHVSRIRHDKPLILMAVGGSFDYISGRIPRAPVWMRNMGLEWLFRLIREPWRLPRQLKGAEFFWRVAKSS